MNGLKKYSHETTCILTFVENAGSNKWYIKEAIYKCECGNSIKCSISSVNNGRIKSCGCLKKKWNSEIGERSKTHNLTSHPLYYIWSGIINRCESVNNNRYERYMGRGVQVCDEWRNDFTLFYNWAIANGWEKGMEIDKDIKGNGLLYSPDTCSIVTRIQNCNKRANSRFETYRAETKTVAEWGRDKNIDPFLLYQRLRRGWSITDAIETPLNKTSKSKEKCLSI